MYQDRNIGKLYDNIDDDKGYLKIVLKLRDEISDLTADIVNSESLVVINTNLDLLYDKIDAFSYYESKEHSATDKSYDNTLDYNNDDGFLERNFFVDLRSRQMVFAKIASVMKHEKTATEIIHGNLTLINDYAIALDSLMYIAVNSPYEDVAADAFSCIEDRLQELPDDDNASNHEMTDTHAIKVKFENTFLQIAYHTPHDLIRVSAIDALESMGYTEDDIMLQEEQLYLAQEKKAIDKVRNSLKPNFMNSLLETISKLRDGLSENIEKDVHEAFTIIVSDVAVRETKNGDVIKDYLNETGFFSFETQRNLLKTFIDLSPEVTDAIINELLDKKDAPDITKEKRRFIDEFLSEEGLNKWTPSTGRKSKRIKVKAKCKAKRKKKTIQHKKPCINNKGHGKRKQVIRQHYPS